MIPVKDDDNSAVIYLLIRDQSNENIKNKLHHGLCVLHETQEVGTNILLNLHEQRLQIQSMKNKNQNINHDVSKSSRSLSRMTIESKKAKILAMIIIFLILVIITIIIILKSQN